MDYSLWWHSQVINGKLHNPALNVCHLEPKPTGKSQTCHSSHYKPQEAIKPSPTLIILEQSAFANLPASTSWDPSGHLKNSPASIRICIVISIFRHHVFLRPFCKNPDGLCNSSLEPASPAELKAGISEGQKTSQQCCWEENQAPNSQSFSVGTEIAA